MDASEKRFAFAICEGCRELTLDVGRVLDMFQEKLKNHLCQIAYVSCHCSGGRFGVFQFGRGCDVACLEGELRELPGSIGNSRRTTISSMKKTS